MKTARIVARPQREGDKGPAPIVGLDWTGVLVPGEVYEVINASGVLLLVEKGRCAANEEWQQHISNVLTNAALFLLTQDEMNERARRQAAKDMNDG